MFITKTNFERELKNLMVYDICMTRTTAKVVDNQSGLMIWFGYKKPITSNLILNI